MNAVWGGLILRAAGDVDVDAAGIPEGAIAIRAENWREMVAMTVRAGLLPEQMQGTVEGLLGVVAGLSGDPGGHRRRPAVFERARVPRPAARGPRAAPDPALTAVGARAVGRHVEVEMIRWKRSEFGPSTVPKVPQAVLCASRRMRPSRPEFQSSQHRQLASIGQPDSGDVDGVADVHVR
jgi:hypothetical protein